jgi:hypothetical protein
MNSFLSADGSAGFVVGGVTVSGNSVTGALSLLTVIDLVRRQNLFFTNNRSTVTAAGPVLRFAHVDGLTVTGNVQPISSGVLASIADSTEVAQQQFAVGCCRRDAWGGGPASTRVGWRHDRVERASAGAGPGRTSAGGLTRTSPSSAGRGYLFTLRE